MSRRKLYCDRNHIKWIWNYIKHNEQSIEEYHYQFCGVCRKIPRHRIYENPDLLVISLLQHIQSIPTCIDKAECGGSNCGIFQLVKYLLYKRTCYLEYYHCRSIGNENDIQHYKRQLNPTTIMTRNNIILGIGAKVDAMDRTTGIWYQCKVKSLQTDKYGVILEKLYLPPFVEELKTQLLNVDYRYKWWMIDTLGNRCGNDFPYGIHTMYTTEYCNQNTDQFRANLSERSADMEHGHVLLEMNMQRYSPMKHWNNRWWQLTSNNWLKYCTVSHGAQRWRKGSYIDIGPEKNKKGIKNITINYKNNSFTIEFMKRRPVQLKCKNESDLVDMLCGIHCIRYGVPVIPPTTKPHSLAQLERCVQMISVSMKSGEDIPKNISHLVKEHQKDIEHDLVCKCNEKWCAYKNNKQSISYSPSGLSCESRRSSLSKSVSVMPSETKDDMNDFTPAQVIINPITKHKTSTERNREVQLHKKWDKYHYYLFHNKHHSFDDNRLHQSHVIGERFANDDGDDEKKSNNNVSFDNDLRNRCIGLLLQKRDIKALMSNIRENKRYYAMRKANKALSDTELLAIIELLIRKSVHDGIVMKELRYHLIHAIYKMYQVYHFQNKNQKIIQYLFHVETKRSMLMSEYRKCYGFSSDYSMFSNDYNMETAKHMETAKYLVIAIGNVFESMYKGHLYAVDISWISDVLANQYVVLQTTMKGLEEVYGNRLKDVVGISAISNKKVYYTQKYQSIQVAPKFDAYKL